MLNYLDASSDRILISTFLREYIEQHAFTLINMENSGLFHMIKNEKYMEIQLMHELFSKVPDAFTVLNKHLAAYIVNEGNKLVSDEKLKHDEYVARIIELKDKLSNIFIKSFNKDS